MDRGYDSDQIRQRLASENINPVIPPKKNRTQAIPYDKYLYSLREKVERFFNKIKQFRRIATRYEKLAETFLAFIQITASFLIVK
jgi:transposase